MYKSYTNLTKAADELFLEITNSKTDFFSGFNVVVPDNKVEKWLKAYWLKKREDILFNVKFYTIRDALFLMLKKDEDYSLVSKDQLKYLILKKLTTEALPEKYKKYIKKDNGELNPINLFDLANELATGFMKYEEGSATISDSYLIDFYSSLLLDLKNNYKLVTLKNACEKNYEFNEVPNLFFFGFISFSDTELTILKEYEKKYEVIVYELAFDINKDIMDHKIAFSLVNSLNQLREIENVHSLICKKIKEDPTTSFSDFLVIAPNIGEYETLINRVFHQDDVEYPSIPFSINNVEVKDTDITVALKELIDISHKGFFTRKDFDDLISNPLIIRVRNLSGDEVDTFNQTVINTNVYRNRENKDDWDYIKKRLLLSKLSGITDEDKITVLSGIDYIPYASIGFSDDSIVKFVKLINDLKDWISFIKSQKTIDSSFINEIKEKLNRWFSLPNDDEIETNVTYKNVINVLDIFESFDISSADIPVDVLFYSLLEASKRAKSSKGDILASGVTFVSFENSFVLNAPYVYFLGASSNNLPTKDPKSEIYELKKSNSDVQSDLFFLSFLNAEKEFNLSYVCKDLKTEEEFYPSLLITKLFEIHGKAVDTKKIPLIPLDEEREVTELFTSREFKNRKYYDGLLKKKKGNEDTIVRDNGPQKLLDTITLTNIEKYLKEPLIFQADRLLKDDDDKSEEIMAEYEPFTLNSLQEYAIRKDLIYRSLAGEDIYDPNFVLTLKEELSLNNELPGLSDSIEIDDLKEIIMEAKACVEIAQNLPGKKELKLLSDLKIISNPDIVIIDNEPVYCSIDGDNRYYFRLKKLSTQKDYYAQFLYAYAFALMDVASLKTTDKTDYNIILVGHNHNFTLNRNEAFELLVMICNGINNIKDTKCVPVTSYDVETSGDLLYKVLGERGEWNYSKNKKCFDENELGYDDEDFDYPLVDSEFKKLLKLIKEKKEEEVDDNGQD